VSTEPPASDRAGRQSSVQGTVNMADVAARAGVSIATVSRALRDVPGVSALTRERIRSLAEELSYVVSPEASRLARRETGRVAVVVPRIDVWFYAAMLAGLERVLREADLDVLVYQVDGRAQRNRFFRELPARRKVDAVVLVALPVLVDEERRLDLLGVEVIVAGGQLRDHPHVRVDDRLAAVRACEHLLSLGHRRIGLVRTGDTDGTRWSSDVERGRGYREALEAAGLEVQEEYVTTQPFGVGAGAAGVDRLLALDRPPTALFAYSDEIAISALQRLRTRGVRVPEEMSVVGVDGHPLAEVFDLTTVDQRVPAQAERAAELVLGLAAGDAGTERSVVLETALVVRGTTAPPPVTDPAADA
jgi:LacI family repressor for deo operon, udp, cdd, tsx, nupC, and nupG